jgi:hypothetical protein
MLDEIKEYYDYTTGLTVKEYLNPKGFDVGGIYGRLLKNTVTLRHGIERALLIISRRFLFHELNDINQTIHITKDNQNERLKIAMNALKIWCSTEKIDQTDFKDLVGVQGHGRYFDYMLDIEYVFEKFLKDIETNDTNLVSRKVNDAISILEKTKIAIDYWKIDYLPKVLSRSFYSNESNLKLKFSNRIITFDIILAEAMNMGPLKSRFVMVSLDLIPKLKRYLNPKYQNYIFDFVLTAALYVVSSLDNDNEYQLINTANVSNWLDKKNYDRSFDAFSKKLSSTNLFDEEIVFNVAKKIYLDSEIADYFRVVKTITEDEKYFIISDKTSYKELSEKFKEVYNKKP